MEKDKLIEYAQLKQQEKEIQKKIKELQPVIVGSMQAENLEEVELSGYGKFVMASRRKWLYSDSIVSQEEHLAMLKKHEEQTGVAGYEENKYILFKGLRDEE